MKSEALASLLVILIHSCNPKNTDDSQYWRTDYEVDLADEIYTQTYPINYSLKQDDNTIILTYKTNQDTTIYRLQKDKKEGAYFYNGQEKPLWLIDKKEYSVDGITYLIYKYGLNMFVTDGCSTHFWSPELGILLTHSAIWRSFSRMKSGDDQKNDLINQLSNIVMNDKRFYEGC